MTVCWILDEASSPRYSRRKTRRASCFQGLEDGLFNRTDPDFGKIYGCAHGHLLPSAADTFCKEQARALREELFFTVDEKGHDAGLTDKGCETLNPEDPESFVMPDLATALSELEGRTGIAPQEKIEIRQKLQDDFAHRSERIHAVNQLIRAHCIYEKDVEYVVQDNQPHPVLLTALFSGNTHR